MAQEVDPDLTMIQPEPTAEEQLFEELMNNPPKSGVAFTPGNTQAERENYVKGLQAEQLQQMSLRPGEADPSLDKGRSMFEDINDVRARNQSAGIKGIKAVGGGLVQGGLIALEELGYAADLQGLYQRMFSDPEGISGNWWSDLMKEAQEGLRESDAFKIYEQAPDENSIMSQIFKWTSLEGALSSAVGFGLSGLGAAKLVSTLGSLGKFKELGRLTDIAMGNIKGGAKLAAATEAGGGLSGLTRAFVGPLASSATANYFMGQMMATDTYNQIMEGLETSIESGEITRLEAQKRAAAEAQDVVGLNMALTATAYLRFGNIFKRKGRIKGWVENPTAMNQLKNLVKTGSPTAFTENVYQEIIQMEQIYDAGVKDFYSGNYWDRMVQLGLSNRALHAGALGVVGGPMQFAIIQRPMMGKQLQDQRKLFKEQEKLKTFHQKVIDTHLKTFQDLDVAAKEALISGDYRGSIFAEDMHSIISLVNTAEHGTIAMLKKDIQDIGKLSEEKAAELGYDADYKTIAENLVKQIEQVEYYSREFAGASTKYDLVQNRLLSERTILEMKDVVKEMLDSRDKVIADVQETFGVQIEFDGKRFNVVRDDARFDKLTATQKAQMLNQEGKLDTRINDFIAASDANRVFRKAETQFTKLEKFANKLTKKYEQLSDPAYQEKYAKEEKNELDTMSSKLDEQQDEDIAKNETKKKEANFRTMSDVLKEKPDLTEAQIEEINKNYDAEVDPAFRNKIQENSFSSIDGLGDARIFTPGELVRSYDGRYFKVKGQNNATADQGRVTGERAILIETDEKGNVIKGLKPFILHDHTFIRNESLLPSELKGKLTNYYPKERRWGTYVKTDSLLKPNDLSYQVAMVKRADEGEVLGINIPAKYFKTNEVDFLDNYDHQSLNMPFTGPYEVSFKLRREGDHETYIDVYRMEGDQEVLLTQVDRNKNLNFNALVEMLAKTKGSIRGEVTQHYASRYNLLKHYDQDGNKIYRDLKEIKNMHPDYLINGQIIIAQKADKMIPARMVARAEDGTLYENGIIEVERNGEMIPMEIPFRKDGDTYALILAPDGNRIMPIALSSDQLANMPSSIKEGENQLYDAVQEWNRAIDIWLKDIKAKEEEINVELKNEVLNDPDISQYEGNEFHSSEDPIAVDWAFRQRKRKLLKKKRDEEYKEGERSPEWDVYENTIFKLFRPQTTKYKALGETEGKKEFELNKKQQPVVADDYFKPTIDVSAKTGEFVPAIIIKHPKNPYSYDEKTAGVGRFKTINIIDDTDLFMEKLGQKRRRASIKVLGDAEANGQEIMDQFINREGFKMDIDPVTPFMGSSATIKINDADFKNLSSKLASYKEANLKKKFDKVYDKIIVTRELNEEKQSEIQTKLVEKFEDMFDPHNADAEVFAIALEAETKDEIGDYFKSIIVKTINVSDTDTNRLTALIDQYLDAVPEDQAQAYLEKKESIATNGIALSNQDISAAIAAGMLAMDQITDMLAQGDLKLLNDIKPTSSDDPKGLFIQPEGLEFVKGTTVFHERLGEAKVKTKLSNGKYRIIMKKSKKEADVLPSDTYLINGDYHKLMLLKDEIKKLGEDDKSQRKESLWRRIRYTEARILKKYGGDKTEQVAPETAEATGEIAEENILANYLEAHDAPTTLLEAAEGFNSTDRTREIVNKLSNFDRAEETYEGKRDRTLTPQEYKDLNDVVLSSIPFTRERLTKYINEVETMIEDTDAKDQKKKLGNQLARLMTVRSIIAAAQSFDPLSDSGNTFSKYVFTAVREIIGEENGKKIWQVGEYKLREEKGQSYLLDAAIDRTVTEGNAAAVNLAVIRQFAERAVLAEAFLKQNLFKGKPTAAKVKDDAETKTTEVPAEDQKREVPRQRADQIEETGQEGTVVAEAPAQDEHRLITFARENNLEVAGFEQALKNENLTDKDIDTFMKVIEFGKATGQDLNQAATKFFVKWNGLAFRRGDTTDQSLGAFEYEVRQVSKMLPQIPVNVVKSVADMKAKYGEKAIGAYDDGVIDLVHKAEKGTAYHEAFHAVSDLYLTADEKTQIAQERGKEKWDLALEEELAEDFRDYVIKNKERSFVGKVRDFFKSIIDWFKGRRSLDVTTRVFRNIQRGSYANKPAVNWRSNISPVFNSLGEYMGSLTEGNRVVLQKLLDENKIEIVC